MPDRYGNKGRGDDIFTHNRDRIYLSNQEVQNMIQHEFAENMSDQELVNLVHTLRPLWEVDTDSYWMRPSHPGTGSEVLTTLLKVLQEREIQIQFPTDQKCLAMDTRLEDPLDIMRLEEDGYQRFCNGEFAKSGMPSYSQLVALRKRHHPVQANKIEAQKIELLKQAAERLGLGSIKTLPGKKYQIDQGLNDLPIVKNEDLEKPIYIFDGEKEHSRVTLQAVSKKEQGQFPELLGVWANRDFLKEADFATALYTYLQQIALVNTSSYYASEKVSQKVSLLALDTAYKKRIDDVQDLSRAWDIISEKAELAIA
jgi:hypothetical protein